jgi:hypothetical protein
MSQFDFGTIDPYVVDGVQLADMLNQWRDAILSWHRGPTRPTYVVPGMMWINDAAGPTGWIVNVYMSPTIGDVALFGYNTTTGAISLLATTGGAVTAATLLAQAVASPSVQWNATGNPIDAKNWRMTVNGSGALVLSSFNDAGVLQNSITFNRDGTITKSPSPGLVTATGGTHSNLNGPNTIVFSSITFGNVGGYFTLANGQYRPPAGKYWIQCSNGVQAPTGGNGTWTLLPYKNAAQIPNHGVSASGSASFSIGLTYGLYVDANGTDVFTFVASIGTGSGLMNAQGGSFSAHPVG